MNPNDPITYAMACALPDREGRKRAASGYVCFVLKGCPLNAASCHAGYGATEWDALMNACYWANQYGWVRVVPLSRAPKWAIEQAMEHHREGDAA